MDSQLAKVYGTDQVDETDVEALATAELATKLAAADEINVEGMSDEEAEALASEILNAGTEEETPAEEPAEEVAQEQEEGEKTAGEEAELSPEQEKIAEADYLGRVMAHAYHHERKEIEKSAAAKPVVKTAAKKDGGKVMGHLKMGGKAKKASAEEAETKEEKVSALDQLAQARVQEILKENGIDPNAESEKQSSVDDEKVALLQDKVNERAAAMLADMGYTFEEKAEETKEEAK